MNTFGTCIFGYVFLVLIEIVFEFIWLAFYILKWLQI